MSDNIVYFVQISDTHIGPEPGYANHGAVALPAAQQLVDIINQLPIRPDFVIHTGDVVTNPHPQAYELARETFGRLSLPIYYVRGNHDSAQDIKSYLDMGPAADLSASAGQLIYRFEVKGHRFLVLDTQGPPELDPQGYLSPEQMRLLHEEVAADGRPLTIFIHHPLLPLDSPWMDANMLVMNGAEVHRALLPARDRLRGVFLGHIHQSIQAVRDGILYVAAASSFDQMSTWPHEEIVGHLHDEPPGFNFVRLMDNQTLVRQHRFQRL
ncbi:MAG: metallophosphoesterase family protein [Candidatus Promineifilaceae bacterium]